MKGEESGVQRGLETGQVVQFYMLYVNLINNNNYNLLQHMNMT